MNPTANQYEVQGRDVARKLGIEIKCAFQGNQCPEWSGRSKPTWAHNACAECGDIHGDKFRVTIKRTGRTGPGSSFSFDFWASWSDCYATVAELERMTVLQRKAKGAPQYGWQSEHGSHVVKLKHTPNEYDILSCVGSDVNGYTDADEVYHEFGEMPPSRAEAIAAHTRKLQAFFTEAERTILAEVQ